MADWYCMIDGERYGPVSAEELKSWGREGRVGPADYVWSEGMAQWVPFEQSGLLPRSQIIAPAAQWTRPHRGGGILALGIIGLVLCFICGIIAWAMANSDLRDMAAGTMDPSGEGMTKAGKICGMIGVILQCSVIGLYILMIFFAVAMFAGFAR
jgi:hypothetical protein